MSGLRLRRYWVEFDNRSCETDILLARLGLKLGCGVTAFDIDDALMIVAEVIFGELQIPSIKLIIEDVDIRRLDRGHVLPNMSPPNWRGVWFPSIYQDYSDARGHGYRSSKSWK
jgi:hypothetical protein